MPLNFDGPVLVPAADPEDGKRTASALASRLDPDTTVIVIHVIEKGGGSPDKAPLAGRQDYAKEVFQAARTELEPTGATVETEIHYGTDVIDTIYDAAEEYDAEGVVFLPRRANRLLEMLSGDHSRRLIKEARSPVLVLPVESD